VAKHEEGNAESMLKMLMMRKKDEMKRGNGFEALRHLIRYLLENR
jgi:hypothetical protein